MQAGELRNKIGFYAPVASDDGFGNTTSGFSGTPNFAVSANVKPRLGGETVLAGRLAGTNLVNITVRQSTVSKTVTDAWRAKDERSGVIYNIRSIIDPHENTSDAGAFLEMLAEKGVAT